VATSCCARSSTADPRHFELIELCLACTIFVALPAVFLRDEHLVSTSSITLPGCRSEAARSVRALASLVVLMLMFSQCAARL